MYKLVILIVDTIVNILLHYSHKYKIVHMNMYEDIMNIFNQSNYAFTYYSDMYTYTISLFVIKIDVDSPIVSLFLL